MQCGLNVTESQQTNNKLMNSVLPMLHHPICTIENICWVEDAGGQSDKMIDLGDKSGVVKLVANYATYSLLWCN